MLLNIIANIYISVTPDCLQILFYKRFAMFFKNSLLIFGAKKETKNSNVEFPNICFKHLYEPPCRNFVWANILYPGGSYKCLALTKERSFMKIDKNRTYKHLFSGKLVRVLGMCAEGKNVLVSHKKSIRAIPKMVFKIFYEVYNPKEAHYAK